MVPGCTTCFAFCPTAACGHPLPVQVNEGELVCVVGRVGSGKSSLVQVGCSTAGKHCRQGTATSSDVAAIQAAANQRGWLQLACARPHALPPQSAISLAPSSLPATGAAG